MGCFVSSSAPASSEPTAFQPLDRARANEVLRYWLASLQQEEALSNRPRARQAGKAAPHVRLDAPSSGQEYFKLPLPQAAELVFAKKPQLRALDAELGGFFESWLAQQYRRGDEREQSHLLALPVVHLPRGELAGLLRCPVQLRFASGGEPFDVPTRGQRRKNQYPPPPTEAQLAPTESSGTKLPFFLDTRLLQQQLGVSREGIDALFTELRAASDVSEARMLRALCELLESELRALTGEGEPQRVESAAHVPLAPRDDRGSEADGDTVAAVAAGLERLTTATGRLLGLRGGRAKVYPVAIVLDGSRSRASFYLQREITALLDERPEVAWALDSCLGSYLTGWSPPEGRALQRALFPGPALSPSQRHAAESCWGSRFSAVQGPPGTGKTTLILHLAAQAIVQQVDGLVDTEQMGSELLVVTSTNNRAVDNVLDALAAQAGAGLPLALRTGSQQVCEHVLADTLERTRAWLDMARARPATERRSALDAALAAYTELRGQLATAQAPRALAFEAQAARAQLELQLTRVRAQLKIATAAMSGKPLPAAVEVELRPLLPKVYDKLKQLSELGDKPPSLSALSALDKAYRAAAKKLLPALGELLVRAGVRGGLGLPPDLPPSTDPAVLLEVWSEALETARERVEALGTELEARTIAAECEKRVGELERTLEAVRTADAEPPPHAAEHEALERELFRAALAAREAWAALHADELFKAVTSALALARSERSLRRLWSDQEEAWQRLCRLFGVWGCTLLSLGNGFPAEQGAITHLVVDEAGQCHPAYAVSGLMRCERALIIGDVHQLEPVIDLEPDDDERVIAACKLSLSRAELQPYRIHNGALTSVQSLADRAVRTRPRLIDHFRCQPEIIAISDALCRYGLQVHTPRQEPAAPLPFLPRPVSLVDVPGSQERLGGSWYNAAEVALSVELMQALLVAGIDPREVAMITPYRGQLEQLRKAFLRAGVAVERSAELAESEEPAPAAYGGVALGTVHRFQGGERSIVLFSSVITRATSLGFLDERANLLNVAVSRARHRLVTLGSAAVLARGQRTRLLTQAATWLAPEAFRRQLALGLAGV